MYIIIGPKIYKDIEAQRFHGNSRLTSLRNDEIRPVSKQTTQRIFVFQNSVLSLFFTAPLFVCKVKGWIIIYPIMCHEVTEEVQLHVFFNLDARRRRMSAPRPDHYTPGKRTQYPRYNRLGGLRERSGRVRKISPTPVFEPSTVQAVASTYNDCAILAVICKWKVKTLMKINGVIIRKMVTLRTKYNIFFHRRNTGNLKANGSHEGY
jgi:hypothetical protein